MHKEEYKAPPNHTPLFVCHACAKDITDSARYEIQNLDGQLCKQCYTMINKAIQGKRGADKHPLKCPDCGGYRWGTKAEYGTPCIQCTAGRLLEKKAPASETEHHLPARKRRHEYRHE